MIPTPSGPDLTDALPSEYLIRLQLSNQHFGDDIRLEGIAELNGELMIITSQPTVIGERASNSDIIEFMEARWLKHLPGVSLGYKNSLSFYRDLDQLAAFDVHPGNILKDRIGVILPIDLILVKANDSLAAQLNR